MKISDGKVWIESEAPLSSSLLWTVPLRLVEAVATKKRAELGSVPPLLAKNLPTLRDIYAAWIENAAPVPIACEPTFRDDAPGRGVSLFFSGGVDSFHSLVKHHEEIDQLVLVHGFDIPLNETKAFASAEALARQAARLFGKPLIVVRTDLRWTLPEPGHNMKERIPAGWGMYHGAALAAVAYALSPVHHKAFIASTNAYADLCPRGSHPLLDPLWSTETLEIVHDGGESRLEKLCRLAEHPETLPLLRVCWEEFDQSNCGRCEKCVRTMLGLRVLGVETAPAFPTPLTPSLVSSQALAPATVPFWRELLGVGLPSDLDAAVRSAIHSYETGLPPKTGKPKREVKRWLYAARNSVRALRLTGPVNRKPLSRED